MATILVIDDDPDDLFLIEEELSDNGHRVIAASRGEEAAPLALAHRPDAVVLDVLMPGLSGYNVLQALRSHRQTRSLPILFLSGLGDSDHRIEGLRRGADDYLPKPFVGEELRLRLEALLGRARRESDPPSEGESLADVLASLEAVELRETESSSRNSSPSHPLLGRYQVLEKIAEGGMGLVLRGWDPRLHRPVALKTLRVDRLPDAGEASRNLSQLILEAIIGARFNHPHIVAVYDVEEISDAAFIAMELVEGSSLREYLGIHGALPLDEVLALSLAVARGLAAAHTAGVQHRDLTPGNVLLGSDHGIKLTDFGLAALLSQLEGDRHLIFGTPGYVAPEVLRQKGHGPPADLFSFGVLVFQSLSGRMPFWGESLPEITANTILEAPASLEPWVPQLPSDLEGLIAALLSKEPSERPTAGEAAALLEDLQGRVGGRWRFRPLQNSSQDALVPTTQESAPGAAAPGAAAPEASWISTRPFVGI